MNIHRYWWGPTTPEAEWIRNTLVTLNPREELRDWSDETLPSEVVAWLDDHGSQVIPKDRPRHRGNMVRLWSLNEYGGWFVDHDVIMLRPFAKLPYPAMATHRRTAASCITGLPAGHPYLVAALAAIDAYDGPQRRCTDVSGDRMLERLRPRDLKLLPLPFDATGRWMNVPPFAVHLYRTTVTR